MKRPVSFASEEREYSSQAPSKAVQPTTVSTIELLQNPIEANDVLHIAISIQCALSSLYMRLSTAFILNCWAQQQKLMITKSELPEERLLEFRIRRKALQFVNFTSSLQNEVFQNVSREIVSSCSEDVFRIQWDFLRRENPYHVDIAYHQVTNETSKSIRAAESLYQYLNDIACNGGIFCSSDPLKFKSQYNDETVLVLARIRKIGSKKHLKDHIGNKVPGTKTKTSAKVGPLKGFYSIRDITKCIPLFCFSSRSVETHGGKFEQQLLHFQVRLQHLLELYFQGNNPSAFENYRDTTVQTTSEGSQSKFIPTQPLKANQASVYDDKAAAKDTPQLWSDLETSGMKAARCSLLVQRSTNFDALLKHLPKQQVCVYNDRGFGSNIACDTRKDEADHFMVNFEGCKILQLEPSKETLGHTTMMPTTLTVGGRCLFTAENYRDFRVMMRTKGQSKDMNLQPNGDFEWPDVDSLLLCPFCGESTKVPNDDDSQYQEFWLLFYPLLQIMKKNDSKLILGSRMICRLTCLECMHQTLGETRCTVCPPLLNKRQSKISFALPTEELLAQAGPVLLFEDEPKIGSNVEDVVDAWTLYNLWENSGAWEALQQDYVRSFSTSNDK